MPRNGAAALAEVFAAVARRTLIRQLLQAGAAAAALIALALLARPSTAATAALSGLAAAMVSGIIWRGRSARTAVHSARLIEAARPEFRNVVVTAQELMAHEDRSSEWVRARVVREAAAHLQTVTLSAVVPLARPLAVFGASLAAGAIFIVGLNSGLGGAIRKAASALASNQAASPVAMKIVAVIKPPPYTRLQPSEATDPDRLSAVQGSVVRLSVTGPAQKWRVRFGTQAITVWQKDDSTLAELVLTESGYFAIEPEGAAGEAVRRLLPVSVSQDQAPSIRIDVPGRDLLMPDATSGVPVAASASDDFGLDALELRYTKVSGSGEQFEFVEGSLPLAVTRENDRTWKGQAQIALASLKLDPGDSLVYRAVARDRRPGDRGLATSDTFFIEIAGPGQAALEGFEMPPEHERYALSQQMVVLKIQRLRARERVMTRAALEEASAAIAAEQRAVRANFVFLMGGHVEDEEVEAEQSHEIQEGRLENTARQEISAAIGHMSRAEQGLAAVSTGQALPPAKAAVDALQRAFGRNRYFLRTIAVRSRVDPSRRLTGELAAASDWQRALQPARVDRETLEARALLTVMLDLARRIRAGHPVDARGVSALAEQSLSIDSGDAVWQQTAQRLMAVRDSVLSGRPAPEVAARLNDALQPVIAKAQAGARHAAGEGTLRSSALLSAWAARDEAVRK